MGWIIALVGSRLKALVASVLAVGGLILLVFTAGKQSEKNKQKVKDLQNYKETRERIDETPISTDRDTSIERLRDNGQVR